MALMTIRTALLSVSLAATLMAAPRARNVILFLGDAAGLPVINAAAAYKGAPQSLFIQKMPHVGLMDTSPASAWVSDSAAGMTAIVAGEKTENGVLSQSSSAIRGKKDGEPLKTILEYAEQHGLSTGVISTDRVTGATPAACYAHSNSRSNAGEIFAQLLKPPYGDGVDVLVGGGKNVLADAGKAAGTDVAAGLKSRGYAVLKSIDEFKSAPGRSVVLVEQAGFDVAAAVERSVEMLSRNRKGYFLAVEVDAHTDNLRNGLDRFLLLDRIIERTVRTAGKDTLVIFAADHSFDTRLRGGKKGDDLVPPADAPKEVTASPKAPIRVVGGHTGEEVVVAAQGPGAERVRGFFPNTRLFEIMLAAYGWQPDPKAR
jgi:alkaline phosphatase